MRNVLPTLALGTILGILPPALQAQAYPRTPASFPSSAPRRR